MVLNCYFFALEAVGQEIGASPDRESKSYHSSRTRWNVGSA